MHHSFFFLRKKSCSERYSYTYMYRGGTYLQQDQQQEEAKKKKQSWEFLSTEEWA